ncbi:hypothetical protein GCM10009682_06080 [Luedemannella flava]|uniref:Uncharacterized protein n=1 Tax=Luedemannella flava TaxID=349316 RepID=A0ABP4XKU0_9ACTN
MRQLEEWGRGAERRVRRAHLRRRLTRILTWPLRPVLRPGHIVAILVVAVVGGFVWVNRPAMFSPAGGEPGYVAPSVPAGLTASAAPSGPFAGTPAAHWAEGAAGIALPAATAVNGFSKAQVADDLAAVRAALVAARLDHRLLVDHDMSAFLKLVAPRTRGYLTDYYEDGEGLSIVTVVGRDKPLSELAPRVKGKLSFRSVTDNRGRRILEVISNFVWVYAFADGQVALIHDRVQWRFYRAGDVRTADLGPRPYRWSAYWHNIDCAAMERGVLAPPGTAPTNGVPVTENPDNYYDPDHPMEIPDTCS